MKFHWKPMLGVHSLVWDECQKIAGKDPDFNRRDLWESIEAGDFPEYELGVQLVPESDEFDFDVRPAGRDQDHPGGAGSGPAGRARWCSTAIPDNFFAETEQVAFHTANVVPGIDFTNDPLLQVRNFSYLDTQLIRLGGPNFAQLPVNRPLADGAHQPAGRLRPARDPAGAGPATSRTPSAAAARHSADEGVFRHYPEQVDGAQDPPAQPRASRTTTARRALFWNSMSAGGEASTSSRRTASSSARSTRARDPRARSSTSSTSSTTTSRRRSRRKLGPA